MKSFLKVLLKIFAVLLIIFGVLMSLGGIAYSVDSGEVVVGIILIIILGIAPIICGVLLFWKTTRSGDASRNIDKEKKSINNLIRKDDKKESTNNSITIDNLIRKDVEDIRHVDVQKESESELSESDASISAANEEAKESFKPHVNVVHSRHVDEEIKPETTEKELELELAESGTDISTTNEKTKKVPRPHVNLVHLRGGSIYYSRTSSDEEIEENNNPPENLQSENKEYNFNGIIVNTNYLTETQHEDIIQDIQKKYSEKASLVGGFVAIIIILMVFILMVHSVSSLPMSDVPFLTMFDVPVVPATIISFSIIAVLSFMMFIMYRKETIYLFYDVDEKNEGRIQRFYSAFDKIRDCRRKWSTDNNYDGRKKITMSYSNPRYLKTNIIVPKIPVRGGKLYFFPDRLFIIKWGKMETVKYGQLKIEHGHVRFTESSESKVPSDAQIVDYAWKHARNDGGRDRRFKDNESYPICLYSVINLRSASLNETLMFSRPDIGNEFVAAFNRFKSIV